MNTRNRTRNVSPLAIMAMAILALTTTSADAQPITIVNPGFEDPPYANGDYGAATGWDEGYYDLAAPTTWVEIATLDYGGGWDPDAASGYGGVAPEGENAAYTTAFVSEDGGLRQILSATLQPNTQYQLSVLVGNPAPYNAQYNGTGLTADYRIELLAGGVLLASDTGPSPVNDSTWTTATLTFNPGASHAQLGQALEIRLLAVHNTDWLEVDYDVVTLSVVHGPIPTAEMTTPAADVSVAGGTAHTFVVTYTDDVAVDGSSIGVSDVTVTGPGGPLTVASAVANPAGDAAIVDVTYTVTPPGGSWDSADDGAYTIEMVANEVQDKAGPPNSVAAGALGSFEVKLAGPSSVIYEPFDYDAGSIDGRDGGTGFGAPWVMTKSHGRDYATGITDFAAGTGTTINADAGLEFATLPVSGSALSRYGSAGRAEAHRLISVPSQAALTGDGTTIWFSVLVSACAQFQMGAFHFGSYHFSTQGSPQLGDADEDRNPPFVPVNGDGFGLTLSAVGGGDGDGTINALAFDSSSNPTIVAGTFTCTIQAGATHYDTVLIAGKINWKPAGTPDELFLFNVTDLSAEPAEAAAIASITNLDFDQSAFNTVAMWESNWGIFDEIRFGNTFLDVMGAVSATTPTAPANLSATPSDAAVRVNWDPVPETVDGYNIYYGDTQGGPYTSNTTVGAATVSHLVTGLQNDTKYYFVVTAFNVAGEGPQSNEASATPKEGLSLRVRRWGAYR